ncbi:MAG: ABC transporter permease [Candidatus Aenigmatarchaeota archaeon]
MKKFTFVGPLIVLLIWWIITYIPLIKSILLPPPHTVILSLFTQLFISKELLYPLFETLSLWLTAFIVGTVGGISSGMVMGYSDKIYSFFEVIIDFFRSLPSLLLIPIAIIFFGIGNTSAFLVTTWSGFFYIFINTIYGVKYARKSYIFITKILNIEKLKTFTEVILPASAPYIIAGLRISLSITLIVAVGSEMILGRGGLGGKVYDAFLIYNTTEIYVIILIVGTLGYISNKLLVLLENRVIHWKGE